MQKKRWFALLAGIVLLAFILLTSWVNHRTLSESISSSIENTNRTGSALERACTSDQECVPASCCHARTCTSMREKPVCEGIRCTLSCEPGTLDCGQARCWCIANRCAVVPQ